MVACGQFEWQRREEEGEKRGWLVMEVECGNGFIYGFDLKDGERVETESKKKRAAKFVRESFGLVRNLV